MERPSGLPGRPFLTFFVALVATMIVGLGERQRVQAEVADKLGVGLDDIPPAELARVFHDTWSTPARRRSCRYCSQSCSRST